MESCSFRRVVVGLLVTAAVLSACMDRSARQEIERLSARVDSFTVTLTAVTDALDRGVPSAPGNDSATVQATGPSLGNADAPVTIVEFLDYQCPFCGRHAREVLPRIHSEYIESGAVRYVVRDLALPMHPLAEPAALAARCVWKIGGVADFWAMHDSLFARQAQLSPEVIERLALATGLGSPALRQCVADRATQSAFHDDGEAAEAAGLTGTPSFIIGPTDTSGRIHGRVIRGARPFEQFQSAIEDALQTASDGAVVLGARQGGS